jgi:hypothetical protein
MLEERSVIVSLSLCLLAAISSCTSTHTPGSTETGNPPVIDASKISLVVSMDEARIVGQPGAVTPGGSEVTVTPVGSDMVTIFKSQPDGSFDVPVGMNADTVIELRAGEDESKTVYVTTGGASVGTGDGGELSCVQRDQLASQVIVSAIDSADTRCTVDTDCVQVSTSTLCRDTCGEHYFGKNGIAAIEAAVRSADLEFCMGFASAGCMRTIPPCIPPGTGPLKCMDGMCIRQP